MTITLTPRKKYNIGPSRTSTGKWKQWQTCQRGHAFTPENTIWKIRPNGKKRRRCRECHNAVTRLWNKRVRKVPSRRKLSLILEGLNHGLSINQMTTSGPHLICSPTHFYNFLRTADTKLVKRIKAASAKNGRQNFIQAMDARRIAPAPALLKNDGMAAYEAIARATAVLWEGERARCNPSCSSPSARASSSYPSARPSWPRNIAPFTVGARPSMATTHSTRRRRGQHHDMARHEDR
jgi:hypothetical protein